MAGGWHGALVRWGRLQRYRTRAEGWISHLKRGYGMNRSRLKATEDARSGPDCRSWPTTLTPSPSELGETPNPSSV